MSIKDFNITVQEQVAMTHRRQAPVLVGSDTYRATGVTFSQEWTGPWQELYDKMQTLQASMTERLDATLTRQADGEYGTLRATWTYYEAGSGEGGEQQQQKPGSSRDCPQYELSSSATQEPVLTHPNFAGLGGDVLRALKMLMDGYTHGDKLTLEDGTRSTVGAALKNAPAEAVELIEKGCTHYLCPQVVVTAKYESAVVPSFAPVCSIVSSVPGPFPQANGGRNWLFEAPGVSVQNGKIQVSETYRLSGPGGWSTYLYGNG